MSEIIEKKAQVFDLLKRRELLVGEVKGIEAEVNRLATEIAELETECSEG